MNELSPEEKLLRVILNDQNRDRNYPVRQEYFCHHCRVGIDILNPDVRVEFKDVEIGGKTFTVAVPGCPRCGNLIEPELSINH